MDGVEHTPILSFVYTVYHLLFCYILSQPSISPSDVWNNVTVEWTVTHPPLPGAYDLTHVVLFVYLFNRTTQKLLNCVTPDLVESLGKSLGKPH